MLLQAGKNLHPSVRPQLYQAMLLTEQHLLKKIFTYKKKKRYWQAAMRSHKEITDGVTSNTVNFKVKPKDRLHLFPTRSS